MLKRLKSAIKAFKEPDLVQKGTDLARKEVKKEELIAILGEPIGNGDAEFLSDMTDDEMISYQREELQGWKKLRDRFRL